MSARNEFEVRELNLRPTAAPGQTAFSKEQIAIDDNAMANDKLGQIIG